jgi:hypothetical protein
VHFIIKKSAIFVKKAYLGFLFVDFEAFVRSG